MDTGGVSYSSSSSSVFVDKKQVVGWVTVVGVVVDMDDITDSCDWCCAYSLHDYSSAVSFMDFLI